MVYYLVHIDEMLEHSNHVAVSAQVEILRTPFNLGSHARLGVMIACKVCRALG